MLGDRVISVIINFEYNYSINVVIKKLISNKNLNEKDNEMITETLYNLGFEDNIEMESNIQYNNPIHKGIILGLLIYFKNDLLKPFYPLQSHIVEYPIILKETEKWKEELTETIKNTKVKVKRKSIRRITSRKSI